MGPAIILEAASHFVGAQADMLAQPIGHGLIHHTYKIEYGNDQAVLLQSINKHIFKRPEDVVANYAFVYDILQQQKANCRIPAPLLCDEGGMIWKDGGNNQWRATEFIAGSYSSEVAKDEASAYTVATCFGQFTAALAGSDGRHLKEIIPCFHDLSYRYRQLQDALRSAPKDRLLKSDPVLSALRAHTSLVGFYDRLVHTPGYPSRIMHHDCKISNILFHQQTGKVICPVDLDTVMPGKFFSDLGDMIRSMACTVDENSESWDEIDIRPSYYRAIWTGYLDAMGNVFTETEKEDLHRAGPLLVYMQSIRFLTDYLQGDVYYKTNRPEHNLDRALNQLILLEKLEAFLQEAYGFDPLR